MTTSVITPSVARVPLHTDNAVNRRIREDMRRRVAYYRRHPDEVGQRLKAINEEWDIERTLATLSSLFSLFGVGMALGGRRRWLYLPLAVQTFYLQHAVQGWCPPLPVLRRLGFRTPMEIEQERCALKAITDEAMASGLSPTDAAIRRGEIPACEARGTVSAGGRTSGT
jgi:hypothetical protein